MGDNGAWWGPILEKVAAKYVGFYERMDGYFGGGNFFSLLTGMPMNSVGFDDKNKEEAWNRIKKWDKQNYVMTTSHKDIPAFHNLVKGHGYTVLGVYEYKGTKLVKMRNPWSVECYDGPWSDKDTDRMDAEARKALKHKLGNDGAFFIAWDDFYNVMSGV